MRLMFSVSPIYTMSAHSFLLLCMVAHVDHGVYIWHNLDLGQLPRQFHPK